MKTILLTGCVLVTSAWLGSLGGAAATASPIIWQLDSTYAGGTNIALPSDFEFQLKFAVTDFFWEEGLFAHVTWSSENFGQTYTATADNDPHFADAVARLTDGVISNFWTGADEMGHWGQWEHTLFFDVPEGNGIDLEGFRIDYFTLTVTSATLVSPGADPNGDGNWTDFDIPYVLTIHGALVPEPSSASLLGSAGVLGLLPLVRARRRRTI